MPLPCHPAYLPPVPYPPPTIAVPSSYHRRCTLGFRGKIRGCSGPGVTHVRRWYGAEPSVPQMLGGLRWVEVWNRSLSPPLRRFFPQIATGAKEFINLQTFFMDK